MAEVKSTGPKRIEVGSKHFKSVEELRRVPRYNGERASYICALCGSKHVSSIGQHTYSNLNWYRWWHCENCKGFYDMSITPHKLPPDYPRPPFIESPNLD